MVTATPSRMSANAVTLMCKRYLRRGKEYMPCDLCDETHETFDDFWQRVSMGNLMYRAIMEKLDFLPNSPTLFNIGTGQGTLSACFKFDVDDTMFDTASGIMPVANKAAGVLKYGGGVGYYLGNLRPEGNLVNSTHGKALGPLGVLRIYHTLAKEITQGGKRDAAQMAILDATHSDIEKFIEVKDNDPQSLSTFNISVAISDAIMNEEIAKYRKGDTAGLLYKIAESTWRTGDPGLYFKDEAERNNPTPAAGRLTGTNPCGEVPLLDNEPCNLGSVNLGNFVNPDKTFDYDRLAEVVDIAIRYLDDVLDQNTFPHDNIRDAALHTRKLGLGVCGWADALKKMEIHYDTDRAVGLAGYIMSQISSVSLRTSQDLALKKGSAPAFADETENEFRYTVTKMPPRNATRTCIAPTGSIAILMGASSGIEPYFALDNTRTMGDGTVMNESVEYGEHVPHISQDISYDWHIRHQAAFQEFTDLAVSKTVNMPNDATVEDIMEAYIQMFASRCKGGTIFRDGCRNEQVLVSNEPKRNRVSDNSAHTIEVDDKSYPIHHRHHLPNRRDAYTRKFVVGGATGYYSVGLFEDGSPAEIFIRLAKHGSELNALMDAISIQTSIGLQYGVPLKTYVEKFSGTKSEPNGLTNDPDIPTSSSVLDYIFRRMGLDHLKSKPTIMVPSVFKVYDEDEPVTPAVSMSYTSTGDMCGECGHSLRRAEGCLQCPTCGWSRC